MTMTADQPATDVKHLPLHPFHLEAGAKLIRFGAWEVPAYYTGILDEHATVRGGVGIFDISHMGQVLVSGPHAESDIDSWMTNNIKKITDGKALYSPMCNEEGGVIDDIIVYRIDAVTFLVVVNASNIEVDVAWMSAHKSADTRIVNRSAELVMFAVQGPKACGVVKKALSFGVALERVRRFEFYYNGNAKDPFWALRTGYTGEDGFEVVAPIARAAGLWKDILKAGQSDHIKPIGFGARDTLRLEAAYRLHGHDMDVSSTPLEAGLAWAVDLNKPNFIGKGALTHQREEGLKRKLVGFALEGRAAARMGYEIAVDGRAVGHVTSGSFAPTLNASIGLGYVKTSFSQVGQELQIKIRDQYHRAKLVKIPFYKKELA